MAHHQVDVVNLLLQNGANVNAASYDYVTALYCAARNGDIEIADLLIENGANVNLAASNGCYSAPSRRAVWRC